MAALTDILGNSFLVTAVIGAVGWIGSKAYEIYLKRREARQKQRNALLRLYTDIRTRTEALTGIEDPSYLELVKARIEDFAKRGAKFKLFGVQVADTKAQDLVSGTLHLLPAQLGYSVQRFILLDRMLVQLYERLQSDSFAELDPSRQLEAFRAWLTLATEVNMLGTFAETQLESLVGLEPGFSDDDAEESLIRRKAVAGSVLPG